MPVAIDIDLGCSVIINWRPPRPRLPALLQLSSSALRASPDWHALVDRWMASPPGALAMGPASPSSSAALSVAMLAALQHLVDLAGGWTRRPPQRRFAYDSSLVRKVKRRLHLLHQLMTRLSAPSPSPSVPGCWPWDWMVLLDDLRRVGVSLPSSSSQPDLLRATGLASSEQRSLLHRHLSDMRRTRHLRWKAKLPTLWHTQPGVIHHWLHAAGPSWGSVPILDSDGLQCTTIESVDQAVRSFWVDSILRHHASACPHSRWTAFTSSRFGPHIPSGIIWPHLPWTAERVRSILSSMTEASSPGHLGIPIAVWRALPDAWMATVARFFSLVEESCAWPPEWLDAYVTMIPKASGGSRPRDQRPITVLEVMYRIWSKGVVQEWAPVLHKEFLGPSAMGFRAGAGTLHLAQLLSDLITHQARRRSQLWLASFDVEKCFDSLPWWAVFGTLRKAGVRPNLVQCLEAFYKDLRRRFRYGQVDGTVWHAANGLAQGCPASPDLLNFLFEAFHRWALAAGHGVEVGQLRIPSASFADDLALIAGSLEEMEVLIDAYLEWCGLLGVKVTKVQVWSSCGSGHTVKVGSGSVVTSPTFRIVGMVLGSCEKTASDQHFLPRLNKALATAKRLQALELPSSIVALLWRTTVLSQALYGCELRTLSPAKVQPLSTLGRALASPKPPLSLNPWRAPEVVGGLPLGDSAVKEPLFEVLERRLCWVQLLANLPGLVGTIHRIVAFQNETWVEPSPSLSSALRTMGWSIRRNTLCLRAQNWPLVVAEPSFAGTIHLRPIDSFPLDGAVFTDGSVFHNGGAAAVQPDTEEVLLATVSQPRSSTHCELVALCLALSLQPSQILTDSLGSLHLISAWGHWPATRTLRCPDRVEVRQFLYMAAASPTLPVLEKVTAHDAAALRLRHPKAVGNDAADASARRAASESGHALWLAEGGPFGDPVEVVSASGARVVDVCHGLADFWWLQRLSIRRSRREWLDLLYPPAVPLNWAASTAIFRRPTISGIAFVHPAKPSTIKWIARVRAGCLNTRARLHHHRLSPSPACPCCGIALEDDSHVLCGCPVTGSKEWLAVLTECWQEVAASVGATIPLPPTSWLEAHRLLLLAALIPQDITTHLPLPSATSTTFCHRLHRALADSTAEHLRRRQELISSLPSSSPSDAPRPLQRPCLLPPDRQLSLSTLRQLEAARRCPAPPSTPEAPSSSSSSAAATAASSPAPLHGVHRMVWLRTRLETLLREATVDCPASFGATSLDILALFEETTKEPFSETPGALVAARVRAMAKCLSLIAEDRPPQLALTTALRRSYVHWSRRLKKPVASLEWRKRMETLEACHPRVMNSRGVMARADAQLASWIRLHPHLIPADAKDGESSMALLILWEVDHGQSFPSQANDNPANVLLGFTKRLKNQVSADPELKGWLVSTTTQEPISRGVPSSRHTHWGVRIKPPQESPDPPWYATFKDRWQVYLESLVMRCPEDMVPSSSTPMVSPTTSSIESNSGAAPPPARITPSIAPELSVPAGLCSTSDRGAQCRQSPGLDDIEQAGRRRRRPPSPSTQQGHKRRRPPSPRPPLNPPSAPPTAKGKERVRPREEVLDARSGPSKKQCTLHAWFAPRESVTSPLSPPVTETTDAPSGHGRATLGPPT
jgi:hypothetical protein